jgi:hypothetical protein
MRSNPLLMLHVLITPNEIGNMLVQRASAQHIDIATND